MSSFLNWLTKRDESYGGSAGNPSGADGPDGGDEKINDMSGELPGAYPTYGDDKPITGKNRRAKIVGRFSNKKCNCK